MKRLRLLFWDNPQLLWGGTVVSCLFLVCLIGALHSYDPVHAIGKNVLPDLVPRPFYAWRMRTLLAQKDADPKCIQRTELLKWSKSKLKKHKVKPLCVSLARTAFEKKHADYWLGTDSTGQSILIRLIEGTEAFFFPGVLASLIALLGGVFLGAFSGFYGGWIAFAGRYITTLINSFPNLILVLLCTTVFGPNMYLIAGMVGVTFIPHIAEEIRRKVAQLKAEEFVMAAEAHGLRERSVLFFHIVWLHCLPMIIRQVVFLWGYLIILETSLNYLGKGVLQKGSSWGKMLYDYGGNLFLDRYWSPMIVTAAVMMTMSGLYFLAEGLQKWSEGVGRYHSPEKDATEVQHSTAVSGSLTGGSQ